MGFDVYGCEHTKEAGEYFRNNVWSWRPLWIFVNDKCGEFLDEEDLEEGNNNSGHMISKAKAIKIAQVIEEALESGEAKLFVEEGKRQQKESPDETCSYCKGTGERYWKPDPDYVPQERKKGPGVIVVTSIEDFKKALGGSSEMPAEKGEKGAVKHQCNACEGEGTVRPFACSYNFDLENLKEFAEFCNYSGGFRIS